MCCQAKKKRRYALTGVNRNPSPPPQLFAVAYIHFPVESYTNVQWLLNVDKDVRSMTRGFTP